MSRWLYLIAALWSIAASGQTGDDLLMPEQAFRMESEPTSQGVRLTWDIADGYYLYRDKFRFEVKEGAATLGQAELPKGKVKDDEFFGRMEIYRDSVAVDLPVTIPPGADRGLALQVTSQGCADIGVCYPPQKSVVDLVLPAAAAAEPPPPPATLNLGGGEANEFLDPDVAFRLSMDSPGEGIVEARWAIEPGYYLYRDKFRFALVEPAGAVLGEAELPPGKMKDDPLFGEVAVFYDEVVARIPVSMPEGTDRLRLRVGYQGCAEAGICYPPAAKEVDVTVRGSADLAAAAPSAPAATAAGSGDAEEPVAEQDRLAALLEDSPTLAVLAFFVAGLLLAFTPCVFPMIPILSGIIVGQGSSITTRRAFTLSVVYVLAMAFTYTVAGVIAGLAGANIQAALQNPWVLTVFAAVFVALAMSMFGYYDLQIPASWQAKLSELSNRQQRGGLMGVAVMGLLSALIVGPCVAPPLAGALIVIGQKGDPVLGGVALFALSLGMGAPLVAVGTLEGKVLPRAGAWMNAVKHVFGVLMLAVALYLLDRVLPGVVIMLLWAALLIVSAIYMGALEPLGKDASGYRKLWKGLGLVMLVYGALLVVGASGGSKDLFQPLEGLAVASIGEGGGGEKKGLDFRPVKGVEGLESELKAASAAGKPVMLDFYADWCISCIELERFTFPDPAVKEAVAGAVLLKADVTANDAQDKALLEKLGIFGPPAILFFGPDGEERKGYRLVGFKNAEEFAAHARKAMPEA